MSSISAAFFWSALLGETTPFGTGAQGGSGLIIRAGQQGRGGRHEHDVDRVGWSCRQGVERKRGVARVVEEGCVILSPTPCG